MKKLILTLSIAAVFQNINAQEITLDKIYSGYYKGSIDGIMGSGTQNAAKRYLNDKNYNNDRLNYLLKANGLM